LKVLEFHYRNIVGTLNLPIAFGRIVGQSQQKNEAGITRIGGTCSACESHYEAWQYSRERSVIA